jgi:hypothetical protein
LPQNTADIQLYHIRLVVNSDKLSEGTRTLLGQHFYTNSDFGLFSTQIHCAHDLLLNNTQVVVYFFTLGAA